MGDIQIIKEDPEKWIPANFVRYFYNKCIDKYGENTFEMNYDKDCPLIKHIITEFKKYDRTNLSVVHFLDWAILRFEEKKFPPPITIGFLKSWTNDFLQVPKAQTKVKKHKKRVVVLDTKHKQWIKEQKTLYRKPQ